MINKTFLWLCRCVKSRSAVRFKSSRIVYRSDDKVPYRNLAYEEWVYDNADLGASQCMFMWRSQPSVVVGRHQNPWLECNLKFLREENIFLARRQSGGGTVFHDLGNLNVSFFSSRAEYDRKKNLKFIVGALTKHWKSLDLTLNKRDDILLDGRFKVSGSAAKLGHRNAYHHCTLLYDAALGKMGPALTSPLSDISTKATASVSSETKNLSMSTDKITYESICDVLATEYLLQGVESQEKCMMSVDPSDSEMFNGISDIFERLNSWDWIYGKTPQFTVTVPFTISSQNFEIEIQIVNGIISNISSKGHDLLPWELDFQNALIGTRFTQRDMEDSLYQYFCRSVKKEYWDALNSFIQELAHKL